MGNNATLASVGTGMNTLAPLKWVTVINGQKKIATTHFGTTYTLVKDGDAHNWITTVTVPPARPGMGGTEVLTSGVSFARARKAAIADYNANGGR